MHKDLLRSNNYKPYLDPALLVKAKSKNEIRINLTSWKKLLYRGAYAWNSQPSDGLKNHAQTSTTNFKTLITNYANDHDD